MTLDEMIDRSASSLGVRATSSYPTTQAVNCSGQLVKQRLGVLQDRRVEAFGERAVHQREEVASFRALALVASQAGEAGRSAQPKRLRALALRHYERSVIML